MRFLLTPTGSHGDVHPYVGIGRRLRDRGHDVVVVTTGAFRDLVEESGLQFVETLSADEYRAVTENPDLWHPRRGLALVMGMVGDNLARGDGLLDEIYRPGDVLVLHLLSVGARVFQEKHRVPGATVQLAPSGIRSAHQVPPLAPGVDISGWPMPLKRAFWWFGDRVMIDPHLVPQLNDLRADLALPPVPEKFEPAAVAAKLDALVGSDDVGRACGRWRDALAGGDTIGTACDLLEQLAS